MVNGTGPGPLPELGVTVATPGVSLDALIAPLYKVSDALKGAVEPMPLSVTELVSTVSGPGMTVTVADVAPPFESVKLIVAVPLAPA